MDDIFLCAFVAQQVTSALGAEGLEENWDGEAPLAQLIEDIVGQEQNLIGDQKERILAYIGWGFMKQGS